MIEFFKKRLLSLVLAFTLVSSLTSVVTQAQVRIDYTADAEQLKSYGLFNGTDKGFELERVATRTEGAVMLVRLLGKEAEALSKNAKHPFTDVPSWASAYVGYLYVEGITKGVNATTFGATSPIDGKSYATFVLRALGYRDSEGDFTWGDALFFARDRGLVSADELTVMSTDFRRNEVARISNKALSTFLKGDTNTLLDKLKVAGVVSDDTNKPSVLQGTPIKIEIGDTTTGQYLYRTVTFDTANFPEYAKNVQFISSEGVIIGDTYVTPTGRAVEKETLLYLMHERFRAAPPEIIPERATKFVKKMAIGVTSDALQGTVFHLYSEDYKHVAYITIEKPKVGLNTGLIYESDSRVPLLVPKQLRDITTTAYLDGTGLLSIVSSKGHSHADNTVGIIFDSEKLPSEFSQAYEYVVNTTTLPNDSYYFRYLMAYETGKTQYTLSDFVVKGLNGSNSFGVNNNTKYILVTFYDKSSQLIGTILVDFHKESHGVLDTYYKTISGEIFKGWNISYSDFAITRYVNGVKDVNFDYRNYNIGANKVTNPKTGSLAEFRVGPFYVGEGYVYKAVSNNPDLVIDTKELSK